MRFRKGTKKDLKVGQLYIVLYSGYENDLIRCVRANMRYEIHMLSEIKFIDGDRIVGGPKGSTAAYSGVDIKDTLIPTDQKVIDDWTLWKELYDDESTKSPLDYSRGVSADQEVDWSYMIDARVFKRFRKEKNKQLGRTDFKMKDLKVGDEFICTGEVTNIGGTLFFDVGETYKIIKKSRKDVTMNVTFKARGVDLQLDTSPKNVSITIETLNDKFNRINN